MKKVQEYWPPTLNWWGRRSARVKTRPFSTRRCSIDEYWKQVREASFHIPSKCRVHSVFRAKCYLKSGAWLTQQHIHGLLVLCLCCPKLLSHQRLFDYFKNNSLILDWGGGLQVSLCTLCSEVCGSVHKKVSVINSRWVKIIHQKKKK